MRFLELVKKRRSLRRYSARPVDRDTIKRCIDAARLAPSACNSQPWSFIVVDDPDLKDRLSGVFFGIYSMNSFARKAPVWIVVVREKSGYIARLGGFLRGVKYSLIDTGIAAEHLVLEAEEEGLGTCWLGWFNERIIKKGLGIPRDKSVDIIITMGYPAEDTASPGARSRRPLEEILRFNNG